MTTTAAGPAGRRYRSRQRTARPILMRLRLSEAERAAIDQAAALTGLCPSSYAATAAVAAAEDCQPPPARVNGELRRELVEATEQLARLGNLLNQLARAANSGQEIPATAGQLLDQAAELLDAWDDLTARAGGRR